MSRQAVAGVAIALAFLMASGTVVVSQEALPEVGQEVPDFTLPMLDGELLSLSEGRAEGPVVLVFFRGAW